MKTLMTYLAIMQTRHQTDGAGLVISLVLILTLSLNRQKQESMIILQDIKIMLTLAIQKKFILMNAYFLVVH